MSICGVVYLFVTPVSVRAKFRASEMRKLSNMTSSRKLISRSVARDISLSIEESSGYISSNVSDSRRH